MPELIWDGKYDASGRRVAPPRLSLPFQTVETVNESAQERQRSLDFLATDQPNDWRNRLIWGDKKYVLPALLDEFAGQVDLVYVDPPFATGADFSLRIDVATSRFTKEPTLIEQKAYRDTWGAGLDSYLEWVASMATFLHGLLSDRGSLYLHLDPGMSHPVKLVLDEVFGSGCFRNHITWRRTNVHSDSKRWSDVSDHILYYVKIPTAAYVWNPVYAEHSDEHIASKYRMSDPDGRQFTLSDMTSPNPRPNMMYEWKGYVSPPLGWRYSKQTMASLDDEGRIWYPDSMDKRPRLKRYLDEMAGTLSGDVWSDINPINSQALERVGYPTQKPEALLDRIVRASSNEGDLVLDCVCGSGTTPVVAERLGRRWIAADLGRFAVHTTRKRLLTVPGVRPFVVQNLGKYERQLWQEAEFGQSATARVASYRSFILQLYHATAIGGYIWLHGLKQGRMVHVGTVDAPVTVGDVKQILAEFRKAIGTGRESPREQTVDVLGWDFAFELNEVARQDAEKAGIDLRLVRIPREVLDKRAVQQGDVRFFELAALSVGAKRSGRIVTLSIDDFVIPLDDVPADIQKAIAHWSQWIDYWAVDWDNKEDTFHNEWQSYRTRQSRDLVLSAGHDYQEAGTFTVVVKVIDILGNDTTKTLSVSVDGRAS